MRILFKPLGLVNYIDMKTNLLLIFLLMTVSVFAQKGVCPGDPPTWCYVDGLPGSTFEWKAEGAEFLEDDNNRVLLRWHTSGTYEVSVQEISADGCKGRVMRTTIHVNPSTDGDCTPLLTVPNIFTPNGDGINDYFSVKTEHLEVYKLQIFTRWGKMVFETDNPSKGWDGKIRNSLAQEGTYFWVATFGNRLSSHQQKGTLNLTR